MYVAILVYPGAPLTLKKQQLNSVGYEIVLEQDNFENTGKVLLVYIMP